MSPFRVPSLTHHPQNTANNGLPDTNDNWCQNIVDWTYQDTIGRWNPRGTSNQLIFAEKHIPAHAIRPTRDQHTKWNGGYQCVYNGNLASNIARITSADPNMFAQSPADPNTAQNTNVEPQSREGRETLGSSHPAVVNFLLGDGSVRGISKSTQPRLIWLLTNVDAVESVSLP
jgi:hypothetical protein